MVLWLILAVLLFGSGAVLGFFSTLFWIIVVLTILGVILWILFQTPRVTKELVEEQKQAYRKNPVGVVISFIVIAVVIILWLVTRQQNSSTEISNTRDVTYQQQVGTIDYQSTKGYTFPEANRTVFKQNCIKEAGQELAGYSQSYCSCALNYLELNYSFKEFLNMEQAYVKTKQLPQGMVDAGTVCLNKVR
jgi:hypothetical protein